MNYIYTVSICGHIVYVGVTENPERRFYQHYNSFESSNLPKLLRYCLVKRGILAQMKLIYAVKDRRLAEQMEQNYIKVYSKKWLLLNNEIINNYIAINLPHTDVFYGILPYIIEEYASLLNHNKIVLLNKWNKSQLIQING